MIPAIVRTSFRALRRDRGAFILSFVLPVAFFSIFAVIFSSTRNSTPKVSVAVVDEDHSRASQRLVAGLEHEEALKATNHPEAKKDQPEPADFSAASAEAAVKAGDFSAALIIPKGYGAHPVSFEPSSADSPQIQILHDSSDPIAAQVVAGMLQKIVMTTMGDSMADTGMHYLDQLSGGLTAEQRKQIDSGLASYRQYLDKQQQNPSANNARASLVPMKIRDVVGENKKNPMVSFYAAGIGVMFLLFTASGAGGAILDEADSGALDRVLSSHVSMTTLIAGKMTYCTLLAFAQLCLMFLWGWAVFHLDLWPHLAGFFVMGICTAFAVANFGMVLASVSKTRAQQGAIGTLLILSMSAIGGSMFPRPFMPDSIKKAGLFTINGWAIDGFTKVFWYDEPVKHLWQQASVLLAIGIVLFILARRFARRWESV
ncbi:MAG TPA: ABC transporter permease [Candidatus Koribacter sp.]|jgi:ABC-2 type transport system permease protein